MVRLIITALALAWAAPVAAQSSYPPGIDPAARAAATDAANTAASALAAAQTACQPMAAIPPVEVPGGTTGSGSNCRLANAANNRISRTGVFSYGTDGRVLCGGSTTCNWDTPLPAGAASYPLFYTPLGRAATCNVASTTNTGFTGMVCTQPNLSIALAGSSVLTVGLVPGQVFALSLPGTQANQ